MNDEFPEERLQKIPLPTSTPGVQFIPSGDIELYAVELRFPDHQTLAGTKFKMGDSELIYRDPSTTYVVDHLFDRDVSSPDEHEKIERLKQPLYLVAKSAGVKSCIIRNQPSTNKWGQEVQELHVISGGKNIGKYEHRLNSKTYKMLTRMTQFGFTFSTSFIYEVIDTTVFDQNSRIDITKIVGNLQMPEIPRLPEFDPSEPGLFNFDF